MVLRHFAPVRQGISFEAEQGVSLNLNKYINNEKKRNPKKWKNANKIT